MLPAMRTSNLLLGILLLLAASLLVAGPNTHSARAAAPVVPTGGGGVVLEGKTQALGKVLAQARVELRRAAVGNRSGATLATAVSDARGRFLLRAPGSIRDSDALYLTTNGGVVAARKGNPKVAKEFRLASFLGTARPLKLTLNERTTVASGFAAAQFVEQNKISGKKPGVPNAAGIGANMVNPKTGRIAKLLKARPNGNRTTTLRTLNTLANAISSCARSRSACRTLLNNKAARDQDKPSSTWEAMARTAQYPNYRKNRLFKIAQQARTFRPRLTAAPVAWTLALVVVGDGRQFDGPGNVAADAKGNIWANNNYNKSPDLTQVCGGTQVFKVKPYQADAPVKAYSGGGLNGAGFGIGIALNGHVWVGNFGFAGTKCANPAPGLSVSEFTGSGKAVSGPNGYTRFVEAPQGTVADRAGNIWIANCGSGQLTRYPNGKESQAEVVSDQVPKAFDVAIDTKSRAWVSSPQDQALRVFRRDGKEVSGSPITGPGVDFPFGLASDAQGNVWVANPGIPAPPCDGAGPSPMPVPPDSRRGFISQATTSGVIRKGEGGGLTVPWGIAVDGNDSVWVANFSGQRVSQFCGATKTNCPRGVGPAQPISPDETGYPFDGLQRNTGVGIDASGNVWLANNWKQKPVQANPGGNGLVVFVGMAAPIKTPNVGAPRQP